MTTEAAIAIGVLLAGIFWLLLVWKARTDQRLREIRDVLIDIRDTPPIINVIPTPKAKE